MLCPFFRNENDVEVLFFSYVDIRVESSSVIS